MKPDKWKEKHVGKTKEERKEERNGTYSRYMNNKMNSAVLAMFRK
jgi:hypothetical protein